MDKVPVVPALFLMCALSPRPAVAFASQSFAVGTINAHYEVVKSASFLMRRKADLEKRMLMVGGDPFIVTVFRHMGYTAFGALTDDRPGVTPYHAVANSHQLSFRSEIFNAVYFLQSNPLQETCMDALKEAVRMVMPGGYLVVNDDDYPDWVVLLRFWRWQRMPLVFNGLGVWKRPIERDTSTYSFRQSMRKMNKNVLPFTQRFVMREILSSA